MVYGRLVVLAVLTATLAGGIVKSHGQTPTSDTDGPRPLVSGAPIPVGTADRRGPLSAGLWNHVKGIVKLPGAAEPVLFVAAGRHSAEPGLFLYRFSALTGDGVPVFTGRARVVHEFTDADPKAVVQSPDGDIYGLWFEQSALTVSRFDPATGSFPEPLGSPIPIDAPGPVADLGAVFLEDGRVEILLGVSDGARMSPGDYGGRDPRYRPFDGRGIWRGELPSVSYTHLRAHET